MTHPRYHHYKCLIEVFENYEVDTFADSSLDSSSQEYKVLKDAVNASQVRIVNPKDNTDIRIGLIYLDIVFPIREFQTLEGINYEENVLKISNSSRNPNDFSIVAVLSLGEFGDLLTGNIGPGVAENIVRLGGIKDVDYIKIPHHGLKNGLTRELLEVVNPEVAVISLGEKNSFGHPHKKVIDMLAEFGVEIKRTDIEGPVKVVSYGKAWWFA